MYRYDGRFKVIERKMPKPNYGDGAIISIGNADGTITTDDSRRILPEEHQAEEAAKGNTVILVGY